MKKDLHSLFQKLTHGVYVIGVTCNEENNAFTASWVRQVSFTPLMLALSINPNHSSYTMLKKGRVFSVNVLPKERLDLAEHFGQSVTTDKLTSVEWHQGKITVPILEDAIAFFECKFSHECEAGEHRLIFGRVVYGAVQQPKALPMIYQDTGAMDGGTNLFPEEFI